MAAKRRSRIKETQQIFISSGETGMSYHVVPDIDTNNSLDVSITSDETKRGE